VTDVFDEFEIPLKKMHTEILEGVKSHFYKPGPYLKMEGYTWKFMTWYLQTIRP